MELRDARSLSLVRLFKHDGGDWEPPDPRFRKLRVDPPAGSESRFAVLYTANTLPCVAAECRILLPNQHDDRWTWRADLAALYKVVRYEVTAPSIFVRIDQPMAESLGLGVGGVKFGGYGPYQAIALELFERFGTVVHGLSWSSFHRNQPGRIYAAWHHHKATVGLEIASPKPYAPLLTDPEWKAFLEANPSIEPAVS